MHDLGIYLVCCLEKVLVHSSCQGEKACFLAAQVVRFRISLLALPFYLRKLVFEIAI